MLNVRLALDWTPNTLHAGFLVAQIRGWYKEAGLCLHILDPSEDNYQNTPVKKLINRQANLAIAPSESVISYQTLREPRNVVAIAAILQEDLSSIVTLKSSGLDRPALLDGKVYASYGARFEDAIVQQMIRNDGGYGFIRLSHPPKLDIWQEFLSGRADATWIFDPWEGLQARNQNTDLNHFRLTDYGIPYGFSPMLLTTKSFLDIYGAEYLCFMRITARAYEWCAEHPDEAANVLTESGFHSNFSDAELVRKSMRMLAPATLNNQGKWGIMDQKRWEEFLLWLDINNMVRDLDGQSQILVSELKNRFFTNEYLPG